MMLVHSSWPVRKAGKILLKTVILSSHSTSFAIQCAILQELRDIMNAQKVLFIVYSVYSGNLCFESVI